MTSKIMATSCRDQLASPLALFNGLLFQALLDPGLAIDGERMKRAQARLRTVLPADGS
ncbi:hypothetical protein [Phytoactinopolyspora limicola]|uniref:hypothetical protein n=1 Tax=Phytoactinopolyspora limicola TaxID=2715536 RepID=UPI00140D9894|nr:hypothetical protein [Phytoactinopolyspora limicola]